MSNQRTYGRSYWWLTSIESLGADEDILLALLDSRSLVRRDLKA